MIELGLYPSPPADLWDHLALAALLANICRRHSLAVVPVVDWRGHRSAVDTRVYTLALADLRAAQAEVDRLTARVDDLLNANNAEVERRREAERQVQILTHPEGR